MKIDPQSGRYYIPGDDVSLLCARLAEVSYQGGEAMRRRQARKPHWWNRRARERDAEIEAAGLDALQAMLSLLPQDEKDTHP